MSDKIHFYKKLDLPLLQQAYNKLFDVIKTSRCMSDEGEFSILNASGTFNPRLSSGTKYPFSRNPTLKNLQDADDNNFIDDINYDSILRKKETMLEAL